MKFDHLHLDSFTTEQLDDAVRFAIADVTSRISVDGPTADAFAAALDVLNTDTFTDPDSTVEDLDARWDVTYPLGGHGNKRAGTGDGVMLDDAARYELAARTACWALSVARSHVQGVTDESHNNYLARVKHVFCSASAVVAGRDDVDVPLPYAILCIDPDHDIRTSTLALTYLDNGTCDTLIAAVDRARDILQTSDELAEHQ